MEINNKKFILILLILAPYIYLFPHTFHFIEMGNDFELLYYSYKKYIFEFVKVGHFPLWSPSESLGYSLIFNPFAQYFYPLSWLLYILGFIVGDLSKHTYLLYTIFGLSIYNVGQYLWLRKLNIEGKYCLIATLITCFGLKLTEILRFPNAIHALAWFPWILYAITLSVQNTKLIKSSILIFIFSSFILTAGYPYYILYGFILFSFYFFFINIPKVKIQFIERDKINLSFIKSFLTCLIPGIIALIIVLPWFLGISEIMEITRDRNLKDINFSFTLGSNLLDQLGSWILPPISIAESNYYFGSIITLLLIYYCLNILNGKIKNLKEKYYLIFFIVFFIFNYQIAAPENSFIFHFAWNKIELIQNFRAFSRINILLIPLISILICFSIKNLIENKINIKNSMIVFSISLIIILVQIYLIEIVSAKSDYWTAWQEKRLDFAAERFKLISFIFNLYSNYIYSIFFLISSLFFVVISKYKVKINLYLSIIILVITELFILANIQWAIPKYYYDKNGYNDLNINPIKDLEESFSSSRVVTEVYGNTYFRNNKKFNINYFDVFGIDQHTRIYDQYFNKNGVIKNNLSDETIKNINLFWSLNGNNKKIFFSKSLEHASINSFMQDVFENEKLSVVNIEFNEKTYNGDNIEIVINNKVEGFVTLLDNWSPGWKLYINNKEEDIFKLFNTYKSAKISVGKNIINFRYEPW
tara:strand:- start:2044 stop:4146 length:2103 start_codon:yes stop_codon:yes gene_type:complete